MGKASSSKKVARAARAGGARRIGRRRNLGFPALVTSIIVFGVALTFIARNQREATASPTQDEHWHAAYSITFCGEAQPPLTDAVTDTSGIHTHGDGVIHIHPFARSFAGPNAELGLWFETVGLEMTDKTITMPDGSTRTEGDDKCEDEDARLAIAVWDNAQDALDGDRPSSIVTEDFGSINFRNDREAHAIMFGPEGEVFTPPESIPTLDNLSDVVSATTTTAPGEESTTTTTPGSTTTTTAPPDGSSTTTPPGSSTTSTSAP